MANAAPAKQKHVRINLVSKWTWCTLLTVKHYRDPEFGKYCVLEMIMHTLIKYDKKKILK